jgi:hypothetical protein
MIDTERCQTAQGLSCDPYALVMWGSVMTHGASKYGVNNWRLGIAYTRLIAAMMRHIVAFASCEDVDPMGGTVASH